MSYFYTTQYKKGQRAHQFNAETHALKISVVTTKPLTTNFFHLFYI